MAEKKQTKISKIKSRLNSGWRDVEKIAADVGSAIGTVKVQMSKYFKENPDKKPVKVKKEKVVKKTNKAE